MNEQSPVKGEYEATGEQANTPAAAMQQESAASMPLMDHLFELRKRLIRCLLATLLGCMGALFFAPWLLKQVMLPLNTVMPKDSTMIYTTLPGAFLAEFKVALLAGVFIASPYIFYQVWGFVAPGLYKEEKLQMGLTALASVVFFITGAVFCYWVLLPFAFPFFLSYSTEYLKAMPDIEYYLSLVLKLILAFGLIFEMPLFAFILAKIGLINGDMLRVVRKYAVVSIFIVAAVLTPPDVGSQLMLAVPMIVLYELGIVIADIVYKNKQRAKQEAAS